MILDLPHEPMRCDHECGRAGARAIVPFVGGTYDPARFKTSALDGINPASLEAGYRDSGLQVMAGNMTIDLLRAFTKAGWPVQVAIQLGGEGHWVVVKGVGQGQRGRVHVMDSDAEGKASYTQDEFLAIWSDSTRHGGKFQHWGIAVGPAL